MPSPRGYVVVDFGFGLFDGMSVPRVSFTPGRVGALATHECVRLDTLSTSCRTLRCRRRQEWIFHSGRCRASGRRQFHELYA